ncbi:MAG: tetratricopeptide repeat protein [Ignavibacteriaceae bacterium]|jgi:tetratricopeptide (TPR) repeat protein
MLTKKKKLSKKEIKEDKLVSFYYKAYGFFTENQSRVLTYAGIAAAIIILAVFYINHKNQQNKDAGIQLAQIIEVYENGAYLQAIEGQAGTKVLGLKKIIEEYGSTENGETAKIYIANSYSFLGKPDEAFKYFDDYSGSIGIYKATALAGQAGYYAYKNNYEKAAELYEKAAYVSKEDVLNPDYLLNAGENYISAGKNKEAKEVLDKIKKDYVNSTAFREIDKYLAQLDD